MIMDYEKLKKEVKLLEEKKSILDIKIAQLSKDEINYLKNIPAFKSTKESQEKIIHDLGLKIINLKNAISLLDSEIKERNEKITHSNAEMQAIRDNAHELLEGAIADRKAIKDQIAELKKREANLANRENIVLEKESMITKRETDHLLNVAQVAEDQSNIQENNQKLQKDLDTHGLAIIAHAASVASLEERAKLYAQKEVLLQNKLQEADRIIEKNKNSEAELMLTEQELQKQIEKSKSLQDSLTRNINDLDNKEKVLKIMELKLKKLAHEAGLDKELKELQESIK